MLCFALLQDDKTVITTLFPLTPFVLSICLVYLQHKLLATATAQ